ncbi:hypothetical protein AD948_06730 [Acetobacter senegalensis]|uniref:Uncharacterized protein n=1 Tax=Acetobacter senegalensis TaxID=446692 RepID=A0A149U3E4_9PROT|nr:hypothetical protein AD948_06730 [Acetobacter senegalensis]
MIFIFLIFVTHVLPPFSFKALLQSLQKTERQTFLSPYEERTISQCSKFLKSGITLLLRRQAQVVRNTALRFF